MSDSCKIRQFHKTLRYGYFTNDMKCLLSALKAYGIDVEQKSFLPKMIEVVIPDIHRAKHGAITMRFMRQLRDVQQRYFLRFTGEVSMVMEHGCGDIFLCVMEGFKGFRHATIKVDKITNEGIDVVITLNPDTGILDYINSVSHKVKIPMTLTDAFDMKDFVEKASAFYEDKGLLALSRWIDIPLHYLFIPSHDHNYAYIFPIFGLFDSQAKYRAIEAERYINMVVRRDPYFLSERMDEEAILCDIIHQIQNAAEDGPLMDQGKTLYGLVELFYAYYVRIQPRQTYGTAKCNLICAVPDYSSSLGIPALVSGVVQILPTTS